MKKTMHLSAIAITCLALFFTSPSVAKGDQKKENGDANQGQSVCNSIKYTQIDKDTLLIREGFSYQKDQETKIPLLLGIQGVKGGTAFILDAGSIAIPGYESALNMAWEFTKPDIVFQRDGCIYTSRVEGATVKFTKEGVLVKGFKVSEKSN